MSTREAQSNPTPTSPPPDPDWVTTERAAAQLDVSVRTIRRHLATGIPGARKDTTTGWWRIPKLWIDDQRLLTKSKRVVSPAHEIAALERALADAQSRLAASASERSESQLELRQTKADLVEAKLSLAALQVEHQSALDSLGVIGRRRFERRQR